MTSVDYMHAHLVATLPEGQEVKKHEGPESGDVIVLSLQPTGIRRTKDGKQNFREESVQIDIVRSRKEEVIPEDAEEGFRDLGSLAGIVDTLLAALLGMHVTAEIVLIQLENETGFLQGANSQEYVWTGWFRVRLDLSNDT